MKNKKIVNLLRSIADMMDDTDEVVVVKEEIKEEKTVNSDVQHALDLMQKIDQLGTVRAYKDKITDGDKKLSQTLKKIEKLREEAVKDLSKPESGIPLEIREKMLKGTKNEKGRLTDALKKAMEDTAFAEPLNVKIEADIKT